MSKKGFGRRSDEAAKGLDKTTKAIQALIGDEAMSSAAADRLRDVETRLMRASELLAQSPADSPAAAKEVQTAIDGLQATMADVLLDPSVGGEFMTELMRVRRQLSAG